MHIVYVLLCLSYCARRAWPHENVCTLVHVRLVFSCEDCPGVYIISQLYAKPFAYVLTYMFILIAVWCVYTIQKPHADGI